MRWSMSWLAASWIGAILCGPMSAQVMQRVSVNSAGEEGNQLSWLPSAISSDGRFVLFQSSATNLVTGDTNGMSDIFLHDRLTGATTRENVSSTGVQANDISFGGSLSADGRYVTFTSAASNLVAGDTSWYDVFVHDHLSGQTSRANVGLAGEQANGTSGGARISADGRFVVFVSDASNLVVGDTNGWNNIFVRDRQSGINERVDLAWNGADGNSDSVGALSISADGRFVAYQSLATNLVADDTNGKQDIFVRDRASGQTLRASVGTGGTQGNNHSERASLSADGRYVVFRSIAENLVPADTNTAWDIFIRDLVAGLTTRASVSSSGTQANGASDEPSISGDGRYVVFTSQASNLVGSDTTSIPGIFIRDSQGGTTERMSLEPGAQQPNGGSGSPFISPDGRVVAFSSSASNLVSLDTNGCPDVFVHDRGTPTPPIITAIVPNVGNVLGSTLGHDAVTIHGSGFPPGHIVMFGSTSAATTYLSPSQLRVDATPPAPGNQFQPVDVTVQTPDGVFTALRAFSYARFGLGMQGSIGEPTIRLVGKPSIQDASGCSLHLDNGPTNGIAILTFDAVPAALPSGVFQAWPVAGSFGNGIQHNVFPIPMAGAGIHAHVLPLLDGYSWLVPILLPTGPPWSALRPVLEFSSLAPYYGIIVQTDANGHAQVSLADMLPWMGGPSGAIRYVGSPLYAQWYALDAASANAYPFIEYSTYAVVATIVVGALVTVATGGTVPAIMIPVLGNLTPSIAMFAMARSASIMIAVGVQLLGLPGEAALAFSVFSSRRPSASVGAIVEDIVQQQLQNFSGSQGIRFVLQR